MQRLRPVASWLLGGIALASVLAVLAPLGGRSSCSPLPRAVRAAALLLAALLAGSGVPRRRCSRWPSLAGMRCRCPDADGRHADASLRRSGPHGARQTSITRTRNVSRSSTARVAAGRHRDHPGADRGWAGDIAARPRIRTSTAAARRSLWHRRVSRWPLESLSLVTSRVTGCRRSPGCGRRGRRVRFLGMHTRWPVAPSLARLRDQALQGAAELAQPPTCDGDARDLNLTRTRRPSNGCCAAAVSATHWLAASGDRRGKRTSGRSRCASTNPGVTGRVRRGFGGRATCRFRHGPCSPAAPAVGVSLQDRQDWDH